MIKLQQVKNYLGITDTSEDTKLQAILDGVNQDVVAVILDYDYGEKEIYVKQKSLKYPFLPLRHVNPSQLIEVNGVNFASQIEGKDYLILENGLSEVPNLNKICCASFSRYKVKYIAGWREEEIPADLIALVAEMVGFLASSPSGNIKSEALGPRSVSYVTQAEFQTALIDKKKKIAKSLVKYIPLHLRIW